MVNRLNLGIGSNTPFSYRIGENVTEGAKSIGRGIGDIIEAYKNIDLGGSSSDTNVFRAPSQIQQIQTQSLPPSLSSFNTSNVQIMPPSMTGRSPLPLSSHTTSKYGFEKIKSPQDLLTTPLDASSGAYTQDQINEILSDLPKTPQALSPSSEMVQFEENVATDPKGGDKSLEGGAEAIEGLMNKSIMDYIDNIRGTSPEQAKTLAKYKEEFAEATGLDVSGKPDTKDALVAFGLALMQNKAGKGFNVGNMLKSVGSAGEKAMPLLQKAKAEAKAAGASAGKYALEMRAADKAKAEKAMEREDYFIVPNIGGGLSGDRAGILSDEGRRIPLNKSELNKLTNNKDFSDKFTILPGSMYDAVLAETMKTPEAAELYDTKTPRKLELFGEGASDLFTIETWRPLPQSGVEAKLVGKGTDTYKALSYAARDLQKAKEKFIEAMPLVEGTNIFRFGLDKIDAAASAFGINFREGATPTQKLTLFLTKLQAQNAKEILGEAGKTISDADRALVASIVGDLKAGSTPEELQEKLNGLFNDIIIKKEQQIIDALATLDRYSGRKVSESLSGGDITDEERKELESYAKGVTA